MAKLEAGRIYLTGFPAFLHPQPCTCSS